MRITDVRTVVVGNPWKNWVYVTLNEDEAAKHPYGQDNFLRLFEEGWERRRRT